MRQLRLGIFLAISVSLLALLPAASANALAAPVDGNCYGTFVTPGKPTNADWDNGQNLKLWNCTGKDVFANVICHPYPTFEDDNVCWSYRVKANTYQTVDVPWNRQVHAVKWY